MQAELDFFVQLKKKTKWVFLYLKHSYSQIISYENKKISLGRNSNGVKPLKQYFYILLLSMVYKHVLKIKLVDPIVWLAFIRISLWNSFFFFQDYTKWNLDCIFLHFLWLATSRSDVVKTFCCSFLCHWKIGHPVIKKKQSPWAVNDEFSGIFTYQDNGLNFNLPGYITD